MEGHKLTTCVLVCIHAATCFIAAIRNESTNVYTCMINADQNASYLHTCMHTCILHIDMHTSIQTKPDSLSLHAANQPRKPFSQRKMKKSSLPCISPHAHATTQTSVHANIHVAVTSMTPRRPFDIYHQASGEIQAACRFDSVRVL